MNSTVFTILKVGLGILIIFLGYQLYAIIQDPIQFEKLKDKRYDAVKTRLEQIRDVQKVHRDVYDKFANDLDQLIAFVDTGRKPIIERKDSSFMYYDETYRKEMQKDTVIRRLIGYETVKESVFKKDFNPEKLRLIPYAQDEPFRMDADKISVNDVTVPVFEAIAPDSLIFEDVLDRYDQYIEEEHVLKVGSLNEPTLSGNWK